MHSRDKEQSNSSPSEITTSSTSLIRNFISGSLAGAMVAIPGSLAETAKKMRQRKEVIFTETVKKLIKNGELIKAAVASKLFYGVPLFIMHVAPATAIQLTTDAAFREYLPSPDSFSTSIPRSFYCGVQGSIVATIVERTIVQQQVAGVKTLPALKQIFGKGFSHPWRTMPLISVRDGIYAMFLFNLNPFAAKFGEEKCGTVGKFAGVTLSSVIGATISHPCDTLATYIQDLHAQNFKVSIFEGVKQKITQDGLKSLYKGYLFRLGLFMGFSNAIPPLQNAINEQLKMFENKPTTGKTP